MLENIELLIHIQFNNDDIGNVRSGLLDNGSVVIVWLCADNDGKWRWS